MLKVIITNSIIPLFSITEHTLEIVRIGNVRILSVHYRLWMYDYAGYFVIGQFFILLISLFFGRKKTANCYYFYNVTLDFCRISFT